MRELHSDLHVLERPQRFVGLEVGSRMTVLRLRGGLLIHSPVDVDPTTVAHLGAPRWVLAPNKLHHLHVGRWTETGLEAWAARGLPEKRPDLAFAGVIEDSRHPFGDEVELLPLTCFPFSNEVAVLHRPSRTLVLTDLLFHFQPDAPWLTRFAMGCAGAYPGCRASLLEKALMHRDAARKEIGRILAWDFDRIVLAHGAVVERDGRAVMRQAYAWLGV